MDLEFDLAWDEIAIRFALFSTNAECSLIGTTNPDHLMHNIKLAEKGPLPKEIVAAVKKSFIGKYEDWVGQVYQAKKRVQTVKI